jgi:membrane protein GlpM
MYLLIKCLIGALIMLTIHFLTQSKNYYLTGLILLFPSLSIPAYYFIYMDKGLNELRNTTLFALFSLIPYIAFILSVYFLVKSQHIVLTLLIGTGVWFTLALVILNVWKQIR